MTMGIAGKGRKPSFTVTTFRHTSLDDDRYPISKVPSPTMASDVDRNPISESPRPTADLNEDIAIQALSLSPDREHSPEPNPRVRFNLESQDCGQLDSELDLTPTKLDRAIKKNPSSRRSLQLPAAELKQDHNCRRSCDSKPLCSSTKKPSGAICNISRPSDSKVHDRGIKIPFSTLGPLASAPELPKQYTIHDHTLGVKTQKQLITNRQTPSKVRKPVVSKVLGLQKKQVLAQRSPMKSVAHKNTNYELNSGASKYSKPEFHSTLRLARAMQKVKSSKVDPQVELRKIMKCEEEAQKLMQKASVPVNIPFSEMLYKNLTPVDVAEGEVVAKLLRDQEAKMKSYQPSPRPKDQEPDLMEFYDDSIYYESPSWAVHFPPVTLDFAVSAPLDCAYSQYRRLRMWEDDD